MTATDQRVTVVSVFFDRVEYVEESVASLLDQEERPLSIVLVDDCSRDGTGDALERFAGPLVRVVRNPANMGLVATLRAVCAEAETPYVAIHGSGDLSLPRRLRLQADALDADGELVAVGCHLRDVDRVADTDRVRPGGARWQGAARLTRPTSELLEAQLYTHGEVMFRRSAYLLVGGYRPVFRFSQDRDLWLRLSLLGDFALVPEVLYERRTLPGGVSASAAKRPQQIVYSQLARECMRERLERGSDAVDRLGPLALATFRSRAASRELRRFSAWMALADQREAHELARDLAACHGPGVLATAVGWVGRPLLASRRARGLVSRGMSVVAPGKLRQAMAYR